MFAKYSTYLSSYVCLLLASHLYSSQNRYLDSEVIRKARKIYALSFVLSALFSDAVNL